MSTDPAKRVRRLRRLHARCGQLIRWLADGRPLDKDFLDLVRKADRDARPSGKVLAFIQQPDPPQAAAQAGGQPAPATIISFGGVYRAGVGRVDIITETVRLATPA